MSASNKDNIQERMKPENFKGESLFKKWCSDNDWYCEKFGFDNYLTLKNFWFLNPILRNTPDFIIEKGAKIFAVQVKGTPNFKEKEYDLLDEFIKSYHTSKAPLIYAFCYNNQKPIFKKAQDIKSLYQQSEDKIWDDGKIYRTLNFNN